MKTIVILAVVAASCAAHGVYLGETPSITLRFTQKVDLYDVTRTPIGHVLQDGSGLETATNQSYVVCDVPREWSDGGSCGALRASGVFVNPRTREILGAMGSYVYPTIKEGAFAMTNDVHQAVIAASKGTATLVPLRIGKDGSGTITYNWRRGEREIEFVIRCFTNAARQMAVGYYIHTKGDDIHCELKKP